MPTTLAPLAESTIMETTPNRVRITRAMCKNLIEEGLLKGRYELIDGEVISKMGQNPPHALVVMLITVWAMRIFGAEFVRCQLTLNIEGQDAETNEPEPDVAALNKPITAFMENHPTPEDVLLLVEVSDTTFRFDMRSKATLYARAGIAEYWVLDIPGRRAIVHRQPNGGRYGERLEVSANEMIAPLSCPEAMVRISDLLPLPE